MTLKTRRILSLIFIVLFLIITPVIVLYAAGYKLKRNGLSIERTGMFIIDSEPKGAKIFLNGKAQKTLLNSLFNKNNFITTPAKIKNLFAGEYDLSLELDGYSNWHKKLSISSGASTSIKDIYLFKKSLPIQIAPADIKGIGFSPDKNQALIISADQLVLFNLRDETKKSIYKNNLEGKNIAWSQDGQNLLIDNYLYSAGDLSSETDLNESTLGLFNPKWSNDILFYQNKNSIFQVDDENLPKKFFDNIEFNDYLIKDGYLYLINQAKQAASLKIINLALNKQIKEIGLPGSANYSFVNDGQALISLYDKSRKTLYLIDPSAAYYSPLVEIINDVKTALWYDDNDLLYVNDFEIWLYNLPSRKKTLITRISNTINNAVMYPPKNYVIYSTDQTINAIELDEREKRNNTELAKFDSISSFVLSPKGDIIYLSGRIGYAEGLYKLSIQ